MKVNDALLDYLFDGQAHALRPALAHWLDASRRHRSFVADHRDKIRKKVRLQRDTDALEDLRWELQAAYLLHSDKRFTVAYEPYARGQPFGPDYAVTYTTSFTFNVEATRVRAAGGDAVRRVIEAACDKLTQLTSNAPNVIVIGTPGPVDEAMFAEGMKHVRRRVEAKDVVFLTRHGFRDAAHFFKYYERLNLVIARQDVGKAEQQVPALFWVNPATASHLPSKALTALRQCFG